MEATYRGTGIGEGPAFCVEGIERPCFFPFFLSFYFICFCLLYPRGFSFLRGGAVVENRGDYQQYADSAVPSPQMVFPFCPSFVRVLICCGKSINLRLYSNCSTHSLTATGQKCSAVVPVASGDTRTSWLVKSVRESGGILEHPE